MVGQRNWLCIEEMELTKNLIPNFALWDTSLKQNESQTNDSQNAEAGWVMEADRFDLLHL